MNLPNPHPLISIACAALSVLTPHIGAQTLGAAKDFSVFVLGTYTGTNADSEGRVAVGGDAVLTNFGVGDHLNNSTTGNSLVVGGNLTYNGGTVFYGNVVYGDTVSTKNSTLNNGKISKGAPIDFAAAEKELRAISASAYGSKVNGTFTNSYGTLQFVGNDTNLNTFIVQASDFNPAYGIVIDAPTNSTVIINIAGLALNFDNMGFQFTDLNGDKSGITDRTHVIYNFFEAKTLDISGISVQGTILAPLAAVNFDNGNVEGGLIAKTLSGGGETHYYPFAGSLPYSAVTPVPEPASAALGAAGLCFLLLKRRRQGLAA